MVKTFRLDEFGYEVEIGKVANQADGAVWFKYGGTVVLSTVVSAPSKEFPGFLPLTVDYRELFSAAGKIPGGYYKREGKTTDREILIGRLIDRSIRPLFAEDFFGQVQVLNTVYSVDKERAPHNPALLATSLALCLSKIPFLGPVGVVEVGRLNGQWVFNPLYPDSLKSDVRLVIAGTDEGITMVEGSAQEISEQEFVDVMFRAHEYIKKLVAWQEEIRAAVGVAKEEIQDVYAVNTWRERADSFLTEDAVKGVFSGDKIVRNTALDALKRAFSEQYKEEITSLAVPQKVIDYVFDTVLNKKITELIFALDKRVDDRSFDRVRKITVETGLLPFTHGSALFTRGRTQALVTATLGGGQDEQRMESIMDASAEDGSFMLHYNFPPFCVGEVKPMRAPSRRETGHGHLAASAIRRVLPSKESFPYTIRVVADMLESDGSTSMATTCGTTMALMQAGVPITKMVSGIAMGLLMNKDGEFKILSDITGFEDQFGLMDFKVAGTADGITAIQMDIKYKGGFPRAIFDAALEQSRHGRLHILGEMQKVMSTPNPLSDLVPKVISFKVDTDKIGAIIGSGGKTIREIIENTGTQIDIEQDGIVKIFGGLEAKLDKAVRWVKTLAGQITPGDFFEGKIRRIVDFGVFVELVPGHDGLVHISNIPKDVQKTFTRTFAVGDVVRVQVLEYDEVTGRTGLKLVS